MAEITEIIDSLGDGMGNALDQPQVVAVGEFGTVYVVGTLSDNAFRITDPGGANTITKIIDATGDGVGNLLNHPVDIVEGSEGNVYVVGAFSDNVFQITPSGRITEIIDAAGDGSGNPLDTPRGIAADSLGNVYVVGRNSNNVFKILDPGETNIITEIIDATGDGMGGILDDPQGQLAVDVSGNVYVTGFDSRNAFKITPEGDITEIIDADGDGGDNPLVGAFGIAVDDSRAC